MSRFPYHTLETAPSAARPLLEGENKKYGMIPNLFAKMAESPAVLQAYLLIAEQFANCSLTAAEQQVVLLTVSRINACTYCVGVHSVLADMGGVSTAVTNALRNGTPVPEDKLEALSQFTAKLVEQRGFVSEEDTQAFLEAGYSAANILEVILGISQKTLSNYTNHVVGTELDAAFAGRAWEAP